MTTIKQLRLRIKSVKSTRKITKAMQMVAASKLRKAKNALESARHYHEIAENALGAAALSNAGDELPLVVNAIFGLKSYDNAKLMVIFTSDRGLCGGLNNSVLRLARSNIENYVADDIEVKVIAIGKKAIGFMESHFPEMVIAEYNSSDLSYEKISELTELVMTKLEDKAVSSCELYFSIFQNALTQIATRKQIIPLENNTHQSGIEIEGERTLLELIKIYITAQLHYATLESKASEEAARTTAMDGATRNAGEIINKLTLVMNRTRQAAITKELIEIISGAEAV